MVGLITGVFISKVDNMAPYTLPADIVASAPTYHGRGFFVLFL